MQELTNLEKAAIELCESLNDELHKLQVLFTLQSFTFRLFCVRACVRQQPRMRLGLGNNGSYAIIAGNNGAYAITPRQVEREMEAYNLTLLLDVKQGQVPQNQKPET
jgi:hypothetical protein